MSEHPTPHVVLSGRYAAAVAYASRIHASQVRKGGQIAYVSHLLGVSSLVLEAGGDENQAIAGLLHDAAEDQGGRERLTDIEATFGRDVAGIVAACSDSLDETWKAETPYWARKLAYLDRLRKEPDRVVLVSIADKVHNSRAILTDLESLGVREAMGKFTASDNELLAYYGTCLSIADNRGVPVALTTPLRTALYDIARFLGAVVPGPVRECRPHHVLGCEACFA
jgi:(p)ppGpp synthase/HD superfamily hydrolase